MLENREDEKFEGGQLYDADEDERVTKELLNELEEWNHPAEEVRVNVSLSMLLKGYTIDELVDDLDDYDVVTYLSVLLAAGADSDKLASHLSDEDVVKHLDELLAAGAKIDINNLIDKLDHGYIVGHLAELLAAGVDPDKLAARLDSKDIAYNLNKLREAGVKIDVDELVGQLTPRPIVDNLDKLRAAGADIDVARLLKKASPAMVRDGFNQLLRAGADINSLIAKLDHGYIVGHLSTLLAAGANPDKLASRLSDKDVVEHLDRLLAAGAKIDVDKLVSQLTLRLTVDNLDELLAAGAKIDADELVDNMGDRGVAVHLSTLLAAGANPDKLASRLKPQWIADALPSLLTAGAKIDINNLIDKVNVIRDLPKFVAAGANKNKLGRRLGELLDDDRYLRDFLDNLDVIRELGVDDVTPDRLMQALKKRGICGVWGLRPFDIADRLDALLRFGVDPNRLARLADGRSYLLDTYQWGDKLRAAGANPELLQPRLDR